MTTDPDFATSDPVGWLTALDRAVDAAFQVQIAEGDYATACHALLRHLEHTEHTRSLLVLEDGPLYGTGEAPDFDVVWQMAQMTINAELRIAAREPAYTSIADLVAP